MGVPLTHRLSQDQRTAKKNALAMQERQNHGENIIEAQDQGREPGYVIYVYNILDREYVVTQPPLFPGFVIPACKPGQKFSQTVLPAFVKEPYLKPGSTEYYYKNVDGRKAATSLLNPGAFPGTNWESQIQNWDSEETAITGAANNLNLYGVWWSLTMPDETEKLDREIKIFRTRVGVTMNGLVKMAEQLAATGELKLISPLMHFAMDYLGKQAPWHMAAYHMITCPNCGEPVKEGIAYHRNSFGERCIVDDEKYKAMVARQRELEAPTSEPDDAEAVGAGTKKKARRPS